MNKSSGHSTSSVSSDLSTPEPSLPGDNDHLHHRGGHKENRRASLGSHAVGGRGRRGPRVHPGPLVVLGLDVSRSVLRNLAKMLERQDDDAMRQLWQRFTRLLELQRRLEDGLCRLMDEKYNGGVPYYIELLERHIVLQEYQDDVNDAIRSGNADSAKYNFPIFQDETQRYCRAIEDELKPTLKKMMKRGEPVDRYLQGLLQRCFVHADDMEFLVRFGKDFLSDDGFLRLLLTLWWIMTPAQWMECRDSLLTTVLSPTQLEDLTDTIAAYRKEEREKDQHEEDGTDAPPPVAFVEILPEKKGLARMFPRRRSSH